MKKLILTCLILGAALIMAPQLSAQTKMFKDAAAIKGVTYVYISPTLLELNPDIGTLGYGLDEAVEELKGLEVVTANTSLDDIPIVIDKCRKAFSKLSDMLLIDINEDGESVKLYAQLEKNTSYATEMVLEINQEQGDYTVIFISGKIDISKIIKDNLRFK